MNSIGTIWWQDLQNPLPQPISAVMARKSPISSTLTKQPNVLGLILGADVQATVSKSEIIHLKGYYSGVMTCSTMKAKITGEPLFIYESITYKQHSCSCHFDNICSVPTIF